MISELYIEIDFKGETYRLSDVAETDTNLFYPYLASLPNFSVGGEGYAKVTTGQIRIVRADNDPYHPFSGARYFELLSKVQEIPFRLYSSADTSNPIFVGLLALDSISDEDFDFLILEDSFERQLLYPMLDYSGSREVIRFYLWQPFPLDYPDIYRVMLANSNISEYFSEGQEVILERLYSYAAEQNLKDPFWNLIHQDSLENYYNLSDVGTRRALLKHTNRKNVPPEKVGQYVTLDDLVITGESGYQSVEALKTTLSLQLLDLSMKEFNLDEDGNAIVDDAGNVIHVLGTQSPYNSLMAAISGKLYRVNQPSAGYLFGSPALNPFSFGKIEMRDPVLVFGSRTIKEDFSGFDPEDEDVDNTPEAASAKIYKASKYSFSQRLSDNSKSGNTHNDYYDTNPLIAAVDGTTAVASTKVTLTNKTDSTKINDSFTSLGELDSAKSRWKWRVNFSDGDEVIGYSTASSTSSTPEANIQTFEGGSEGSSYVGLPTPTNTGFDSDYGNFKGTDTGSKHDDIVAAGKEPFDFWDGNTHTLDKYTASLTENGGTSNVSYYVDTASVGQGSPIITKNTFYKPAGTQEWTSSNAASRVNGFIKAQPKWWKWTASLSSGVPTNNYIYFNSFKAHNATFLPQIIFTLVLDGRSPSDANRALDGWETGQFRFEVKADGTITDASNVTELEMFGHTGKEYYLSGKQLYDRSDGTPVTDMTSFYYTGTGMSSSYYSRSIKGFRMKTATSTDWCVLSPHTLIATLEDINFGVAFAWDPNFKLKRFCYDLLQNSMKSLIWQVKIPDASDTTWKFSDYSTSNFKNAEDTNNTASKTHKEVWDGISDTKLIANNATSYWQSFNHVNNASEKTFYTGSAPTIDPRPAPYKNKQAALIFLEHAGNTIPWTWQQAAGRTGSEKYYCAAYVEKAGFYTWFPIISDSWTIASTLEFEDIEVDSKGVEGESAIKAYFYEDARKYIYDHIPAAYDDTSEIANWVVDEAEGAGWADGRVLTGEDDYGYWITQVTVNNNKIAESRDKKKLTFANGSSLISNHKNTPHVIKLDSVTQPSVTSTYLSNIFRLYRSDNKTKLNEVFRKKPLDFIIWKSNFNDLFSLNNVSLTKHETGGLVFKVGHGAGGRLGISYDELSNPAHAENVIARRPNAYVAFEGFAGTRLDSISCYNNSLTAIDTNHYLDMRPSPSGSVNLYPLETYAQSIALHMTQNHSSKDGFDAAYEGKYWGFTMKIFERILPAKNEKVGSTTYGVIFAADYLVSDLSSSAIPSLFALGSSGNFIDAEKSLSSEFHSFDPFTGERLVFSLRNPYLDLDQSQTVIVYDDGVRLDDELVLREFSPNRDEEWIHLGVSPFGQIAITGTSYNGKTIYDFFQNVVCRELDKEAAENGDIRLSLTPDFSMTEKYSPSLDINLMHLPFYQSNEITVIEMAEKVAKQTNHQFYFSYQTENGQVKRKLHLIDVNYMISKMESEGIYIEESEILSVAIEYGYPIKAFEATLEKNYSFLATEGSSNASNMKKLSRTYRIDGTGVGGNIENLSVFGENETDGRRWLSRIAETRMMPKTSVSLAGIRDDLKLGMSIVFNDELRKLQIYILIQSIGFDFNELATSVSGISKFKEILYT